MRSCTKSAIELGWCELCLVEVLTILNADATLSASSGMGGDSSIDSEFGASSSDFESDDSKKRSKLAKRITKQKAPKATPAEDSDGDGDLFDPKFKANIVTW